MWPGAVARSRRGGGMPRARGVAPSRLAIVAAHSPALVARNGPRTSPRKPARCPPPENLGSVGHRRERRPAGDVTGSARPDHHRESASFFFRRQGRSASSLDGTAAVAALANLASAPSLDRAAGASAHKPAHVGACARHRYPRRHAPAGRRARALAPRARAGAPTLHRHPNARISAPCAPFVYRLGRQIFNLKRRVRLP